MNNPFDSNKIFQHFDRLAIWQSGGLPAPVTVELDLTNACNHACPGCTFSYLVNIDKSSLPFDLAKRVVTELSTMGVKAITFSGGGEPLVYGADRVRELIQMVYRYGMDSALITNGSLLMPDEDYEVCEWVRISLDAYDVDTFQRFHGRSEREFNRVVERVTDFAAEGKRRKELGLRWPTVGVGFLTDADTLERGDIWRMSRFCATIPGIDYLQFRPLVANMVADPSLNGGYERFSKVDAKNIELACQNASGEFGRDDFKVLSSAGKYSALARLNFGREYDHCLAHFLEATISANGKVYICCHGQNIDRFCLGDLHEQSFSEIWHGSQAKRVYESINPAKDCPPACRLHIQNSILHDIIEGTSHKNFI